MYRPVHTYGFSARFFSPFFGLHSSLWGCVKWAEKRDEMGSAPISSCLTGKKRDEKLSEKRAETRKCEEALCYCPVSPKALELYVQRVFTIL